jgi:hypothetical protein
MPEIGRYYDFRPPPQLGLLLVRASVIPSVRGVSAAEAAGSLASGNPATSPPFARCLRTSVTAMTNGADRLVTAPFPRSVCEPTPIARQRRGRSDPPRWG